MSNRTVHSALHRLIAERPRFHSPQDWDPNWDSQLLDWGVDPWILSYISEVVTPGDLTLETGSGASTVCFAITGSEHVCISPVKPEHDRVRAYCQRLEVSTDRIRFVDLPSEVYLPSMDLRGRKLD